MRREDEKVVTRALNLFFILFLGVGFVLGGVVAIFYRLEAKSFLSDLEIQERHSIELQTSVIKDEFDSIVKDVLFLAKQNEIISFLDFDAVERLKGVEQEYLQMSILSRVYDQIRFLDDEGSEIVRINYDKGKPNSVAKEKLQNKGKRYYFTDCFRLGSGEIFVSPLDLNMEKGKIELPLKPMIRFGTPVYDSHGNKRGIVLLNYLARQMLDRITRSSSSTLSSRMLLNNHGYWLLSPEKKKEWGFMFDVRTNATFANEYPAEWQRMLEQESGQFQTDNGFFTFRKVYPLQEGYRSSTGSSLPYSPSVNEVDPSHYFWILVSYVSPDDIKGYTQKLMVKLFLVGGGLFILVAFGAWHLALAVVKRKIYQSQLVALAMYDSLTGLPNRKNFFDRLEVEISHAKRHKRKVALLYIDLDGFKEVNDTKGHGAGDELLVHVGKVLTASVRKSDTVARLGGDEFAIILSEVANIAGAKSVGDKIVKALGEPVQLSSGTVHIGASVGIAAYPEHEDSREALVKLADAAMYESKRLGKNTCTIVEDCTE